MGFEDLYYSRLPKYGQKSRQGHVAGREEVGVEEILYSEE